MFGIVIALNKEAEALLKKVKNLNKIKFLDKTAYSGKLCKKDVVIAISGIGKVNAALTTQRLIDEYSPDFILNFGTCGGMNGSVKVLNYYAIENCCQFDFDLSELDPVPVGYIQDYDTVFFPTCLDGLDGLEKATLASADRFICKEIDVKTANDMGANVGDMEGGAIAQVCLSNKTPLYVIKGISDVHGSGTAQEQFFKNLAAVGEGFPDVIIDVVKNVYATKKYE